MITLEHIIDLAWYGYKISSYDFKEDTIDEIVRRAEADVEEVSKIDKDSSIHVFLYYIVLVYLEDKYIHFFNLHPDDKKVYTKETIEEIKRVWNLKETKNIRHFLKEAMSMQMPYKYRGIGLDFIRYDFNVKNHFEDFKTLCEMEGRRYEYKEANDSDKEYHLIIHF